MSNLNFREYKDDFEATFVFADNDDVEKYKRFVTKWESLFRFCELYVTPGDFDLQQVGEDENIRIHLYGCAFQVYHR